MLLEGPSSVYKDSLELYQMVMSLPPGVLASNPSLAYRIALLASIQREPPYVDPARLQTAFKHLTGAEIPMVSMPSTATPSVSTVHANPLTPPSDKLNEALTALADLMGTPEVKERLGESLGEEAKGLEEMVEGVKEAVKSGSISPEEAKLTLDLLKAIQDIVGSEGGNIRDVTEAIKKIREILGENVEGEQSGNVREPKLPTLTGSSKESILNPMPSQAPSIQVAMPRVSGAALLPPKELLLLIVMLTTIPLAYMFARRVNVMLLKMRIRSYVSRTLATTNEGRVNPVIDLFSKILDTVGSKCRPRYNYETHREYADVLDEPSYTIYMRAAKVYELVKFGGRGVEKSFVDVLREALEELIDAVACKVVKR